jgi:hypothetical protein
MGSLEELEQRIAAIEAELRGHTRVLSALRETQLEHYAEHKADAAEIKSGGRSPRVTRLCGWVPAVVGWAVAMPGIVSETLALG